MQCNTMTPNNAVLSPRVVFKTSPAFVLNTATSYCTCFPRPWLYSGADGSPKMRAGRSDHLRTEICSVGGADLKLTCPPKRLCFCCRNIHVPGACEGVFDPLGHLTNCFQSS